MNTFVAIVFSFAATAFTIGNDPHAGEKLANLRKVNAEQQAAALARDNAKPKDWDQQQINIENKIQARKEKQRADAAKLALANSPLHKWVVLGNTAASMARITDYKNDGTVTITRRDGKKFEFNVEKLGKADREYVATFVRESRL